MEQIEAFPAVMMISKETVTVAVPSSRPEAVPIVICAAGSGESTILEFGTLIERKQSCVPDQGELAENLSPLCTCLIRFTPLQFL